MPSVVDQMGRSVLVPDSPKRIVSLVPSQTELLYDFGLGNAVVGQTQFCIHPREAFAKATKIGGTKRLNLVLFIFFLVPNDEVRLQLPYFL